MDDQNNQDQPGPDMSDASSPDPTLNDSQNGEEGGGGPPQGAGEQGRSGQQEDSSGGGSNRFNKRGFDNISKANKSPADLSKKGGQPVNKGHFGGKTGGKGAQNAGRFAKGAKGGIKNAGRFAAKEGGKQLATKGAATAIGTAIGAPTGPGAIVTGLAAGAITTGAEQAIRHPEKTTKFAAIGCVSAFAVFIFFVIFFSSIFSVFFPKASQAKPAASSVAQAAPATGIIPPPNLDLGLCKPVRAEYSYGVPGEYCKMPPSLDDAYVHTWRKEWRDYGPQVWGSKELIGVLYTVAQKWSKLYCDDKGIPRSKCKAQLRIGDMTSPYHFSHIWGTTVDLRATTDGIDCVANFAGSCRARYNEEATVELGKLIIDTGYMHKILHNAISINYTDPKTGKSSSVNRAIFDYARYRYPDRFKLYLGKYSDAISWVGGHDDHFHLYIDRYQTNYAHNRGGFFGFFSNVVNKSKLKDCRTISGVGCNFLRR